jgi:HSP20 family molecular chaperone IbpA
MVPKNPHIFCETAPARGRFQIAVALNGTDKAAERRALTMNRMQLNSPFLLGFEHIERMLERAAKAAEGYPPYNIEHLDPGRLRITLAVAGFAAADLSVTVEDSQLVIRGRQSDSEDKTFLHRGIAARQFHKSFVLAEGIEVLSANLSNGLLSIELERPPREPAVRNVPIRSAEVHPGDANNRT